MYQRWWPIVLGALLAGSCARPAADCDECAVDADATVTAATDAQGPAVLFDTTDFPPRWNCGTWSDVHGWVHIVADLATWVAYMAIPLVLLLLIRRRRDVPFPAVLGLFVAFIVCCGMTHLLEAAMFWWPAYRLMGLVKLVTAVVSVVTAVVMVFVLPDILAMKSPRRLEEEVERRTRELDKARLQAQEAMESKARFTANVSHELRTPMTAVLGYAELLADDGRLDGDQREMLRIIRGNGQHLLSIINDVLDISRSEAGQMPLHLASTDVVLLVYDVAATMHETAQRKGVEVRTELPDQGVPLLQVDEQRLRQVLLNLVGNAVKFTERGEVSVEMTVSEPAAGKCTITVDVTDTGVGMTAEQSGKVFEEYVQADTSVTRKFGGSGLGLTISRRLARAMDGDVVVLASEPGRGTTMRLQLDAIVGDGKDVAGAGRCKCDADLSLLTGSRLLVVDDAADNRLLFRKTLEKSGADVTLATNGTEAIDKVLAAAAEEPFDVVLMDVQMPGLDGLSATAQLREAGIEHPILALTANTGQADRRRSRDAGCDGHLSKPITQAELCCAVARAIHASRDVHQQS